MAKTSLKLAEALRFGDSDESRRGTGYEDEAAVFSGVEEDRAPEFESEDAEERSGLDLSPGPREDWSDSVQTYLREMARVPLLTREGEVSLAQRIERGALVAERAMFRS